MALKYFSKLPIIEYPLSKTETKKARDILHRIFFDQKFLNNSEYVRQYRVLDGDRPEIISDKLYQRPDLYSIIMLLNDFDVTMLSGLPVSSAVYDDYIKTKYSDSVHYLIPTLPSGQLNWGVGGSGGGYVFPMFGYGFNIGEKVFAADSSGFQIYDIRAYVKEWNPITSSVKLDVISGSFPEGTTISNADGSVNYRIAHIKEGRKALHHFESKQTTISGGTPLIKGSVIDPLSRIDLLGTGIMFTPLGMVNIASTSRGLPAGFTGSYNNVVIYYYNTLKGDLSNLNSTKDFIKVVTNEEYEEKIQERKRLITVPTQERTKLGELVSTVSEILDNIQTG